MTAERIARAAPLLALIRKHESDSAVGPQGVESAYDVVWSGIAPRDRPRKLTAMTVERVLWWQDLIDPAYQSEAAGAYQIMEDTLRTLEVDHGALFNAATQDALALQLLDRRGWAKCEAGKMTPTDFGNQLAREWASLPVLTVQKRGGKTIQPDQSYYAGDGLNKAHASVAEVRAAIAAALRGAPEPEAPPSVDDRVTALERRVAALEARA